jgi:glucoamylase
MPRDIPVGNGRLLVCFDKDYAIRDLYFPHVGQENHVGGRYCRLGLWVGGRFSWVGPGWKVELGYEPDTLVTRVNLYHPDLGVLLACRDAVDFHENIYLREITVDNLAAEAREMRLFFSLDFSIYGNAVGDTAAYDPQTGALVHYKGARYFLANGSVEGEGGLGGAAPGHPGQFAVGQKGQPGKEGTFKDAEDGELSGNPIAQGSVDSVLGLTLTVESASQGKAYFWLAAGESWAEVRSLDALVKHHGPPHHLQRTADYWHLWVNKETPPIKWLPEKVANLYHRSLLVLRTQIDWQGGILAGNDSDVIQFNRDTYSYVWPRDGALVANALDLAGFPELSQNFFLFLAGLIEKDGYLLHKYNPDGTLASSWHPWYQEGRLQLPIQEDSTALAVWALWHHFVLYRNIEFIKPLYRSFVKRAADFMCNYRDEETGLPAASYDLWEERRGILSFTVGAVFGGLTAAALFCEIFGERDRADHYRREAAAIRDAASAHLWREDLNRFCRMLSRRADGALVVDATCDASLWGLFAFGLYNADDPRIRATMAALKEALWVKTPAGGLARYENDDYYRVSPELPGNPWFICTLWLADYLIESGRSAQELDEAIQLLAWVADHALPSGVLAEQVHPLTGEPLSITPLTWSHATFIATAHRVLRRSAKEMACPACGATPLPYMRRDDWIERLYGTTCDSIYGICKI